MATISNPSFISLRNDFNKNPWIQTLSSQKKEKLFDLCLADYQKSVQKYEQAAASVAFDHPSAKRFAHEFCQRMGTILLAYNAVLEEEAPSCAKNPLFTPEFMSHIRFTQFFGNTQENPGSVGMNAIAIINTIEKGNLREQMTLVYKTVFSFFINEVLENPGMIAKINQKLALLPAEHSFQIDEQLYLQEKMEGKGIIDSSKGKLVKQIPVVDTFRNVEQARISKPPIPPSSTTRSLQTQDIPDLSLQELRIGTGYAKQPHLCWIPGKDWCKVSPTSSFAQQVAALGDLPILTGPSGTADGIIHLSNYIGLKDLAEDALLACIGWMVPVGDHTVHEIRVAGVPYGVSYLGMPEDFQNFYPQDPKVKEKIDDILQRQGVKNPSYYFSQPFQLSLMEELAPASLLPEEIGQDVVVSDLKNFNESLEIIQNLREFNLNLRKYEAMYLHLAALKTTNDDPTIQEKIEEITDLYNACHQEKIDYVRANVQVQNQVYAMAVPRTLAQGTNMYTANRPEKIQNIVYNTGFAPFTNPLLPATCRNEGFKLNKPPGQFGGNEMGEIGHYFSIGSPAYLNSDRLAIKLSSNAHQQGAAIMSVSELSAAGFTDAQIEQGYEKLQREYPFIQNDGLPPKDTEIVLFNPQGRWNVEEFLLGNGPHEINWQGSRQDYEDMAFDNAPPIHPSWGGVVIRQQLLPQINESIEPNLSTSVVVFT